MKRHHEVIVVGGGVIGCAVAYELSKRSVKVLLIDKSLPGRATSASAGGLWPLGEAVGLGCGVIYHAAAADAGEQGSADPSHPEALPEAFREFLVQSNARFPQLSEELRAGSGVDIEYQPGTGLLFAIYNESDLAFVEQVARSMPAEARLDRLSAEEVGRLEPQLTHDLLGGALLAGEHQVNPMALAEAFKRAAMQLGTEFRHHVQVTALRRQGQRMLGVETADGFLPCGWVVNAAGAWAGPLAATAGLSIPVFPVRGQIVLTESLPRVLNSCLSTSSCYLSQKQHGEVLIGSTTERVGFDVSVTEDAIRSLCQGACRALPMLRHVNVKRVWAGLRPGTPDELPILGPMAGLEGYINAAGGFRTGIVAAPLTGRVVAQAVAGEPTDVSLHPFSAARFSRQSLAGQGASHREGD
jgi:hydrogen cyanide synthase HcnC